MISTDKSFLDHEFMHKGFNDPQMYWTNDVPEDDMVTLIEQSCCFGLYLIGDNEKREQIGMARMVTDYVTVGYLTVSVLLYQLK